MNDATGDAAEAFLAHFGWIDGHADVWNVFADAKAFSRVVVSLVEPWRGSDITKVCGIEARGFILGGAAAMALDAGFVAVRKSGSLFPGPKAEIESEPDYRGIRQVLQIQRRSVRPGDRVLLVDDWIERGSQAAAARHLVEECGGILEGIAVVVDQLDDDLRARLPTITSTMTARDLPPDSFHRTAE